MENELNETTMKNLVEELKRANDLKELELIMGNYSAPFGREMFPNNKLIERYYNMR